MRVTVNSHVPKRSTDLLFGQTDLKCCKLVRFGVKKTQYRIVCLPRPSQNQASSSVLAKARLKTEHFVNRKGEIKLVPASKSNTIY